MAKKITAPNVGIEYLSFYYTEDIETDFPKRYSLPPNGDAIPSHLEQLFELSPGDATLRELLYPSITDMRLFQPSYYHSLFNQTALEFEELAEKLESKDLAQTAHEMKKIHVDQQYLTMAFNLLLQV